MKTIICAIFLLLIASCEKPGPVDPFPKPTPAPTIEVGAVQRGFTLDSVSNFDKIVSVIKKMPFKPWVRIVFDYPNSPADYEYSVDAICRVATCIGQHSDSVYTKKMSEDQYGKRLVGFISAFPQIEIWESCNECNMTNGAADNSSLAKADLATHIIKSFGKKAMYVPYWNTKNCADKNGEYYEWTKNLSAFVKAETDYAALSVYGFDCDGGEPSYSVLDFELDRLGVLFPKAHIGIGEYGKQGNAKIIRYYLDYRRIGFGGYWHQKDLIEGNLLQEFVK